MSDCLRLIIDVVQFTNVLIIVTAILIDLFNTQLQSELNQFNTECVTGDITEPAIETSAVLITTAYMTVDNL